MTALPEHIDLPEVGVILRRYRKSDLDGLFAAVEENRDHLRPHMPWADEARQELATFLADAIAQWDRVGDRNYAIVDAADGRYLGGCGLHDRIGPDGREIGYWLRSDATGCGIITAAARALTAAALAIDGVERVEIHCDEANVRSAAVARRLGYRLDRIEDHAVTAPGDLGRSMIWVDRKNRRMYSESTAQRALDEIRRICIDLPETTERLSHGSPTFFVRGKKTFVMFLDDHHGDGHLAIWCAAPPGVQEQLVEQEPDRFFRPPYVGHRGWLGVELSVDPDWDEVAAICADAYRQVAPKSLVAALDARVDGRS